MDFEKSYDKIKLWFLGEVILNKGYGNRGSSSLLSLRSLSMANQSCGLVGIV